MTLTTPSPLSEPIPMLLFCPKCGTQHIDASEEFKPVGMCTCAFSQDECETCEANREAYQEIWTNPPHKSHLCAGCGNIWRPADIATTGVASIKTKGKADTWDSTAPTTGSAPEINQCDGCRVNAPLTERYGNHAMPDGGFMACTKDRYAAPTQGADDTQVVIAGLNALLHDAQDEIARLTATQGADARPVAIEAPRPSVFRSFETMCWPAPCEALGEIGHRLTYDHSDKSDRLVAASVISAYQHLMSMPAKRRDAIVSELRIGPGVIAASAPMEKT